MSPVDFICAVIVFVGGWFLGAAEWHLKRPAKLESKPAPKKVKKDRRFMGLTYSETDGGSFVARFEYNDSLTEAVFALHDAVECRRQLNVYLQRKLPQRLKGRIPLRVVK